MRYWEFILTTEKSEDCDLSRPERGTMFLRTVLITSLKQQFARQAEEGDTTATGPQADRAIDTANWLFKSLEGKAAKEWEEGIRALRSVSARLEGFKTIPAGIADDVADSVLAKYVQRLTPVVVINATPSQNHRRVISKKSPATVRMYPTAYFTVPGKDPDQVIYARSTILSGLWPILAAGDRIPTRENWARTYASTECNVAIFADVTLQRAFASLVVDPLNPVCAKCGCDLGLTPKARTPRAGMCKPCRNKDWHDRQPKEKLREQWRARKAAERSQTKGGA